MLYMTRESYQTRYVSIKCYYYYCIFACLKFDLIFEGMLYVYIGFYAYVRRTKMLIRDVTVFVMFLLLVGVFRYRYLP